jgi:tetratricopeptide (TPR) repeat protein
MGRAITQTLLPVCARYPRAVEEICVSNSPLPGGILDHRAIGEYDLAIGCCLAALEICPDDIDAISNLGAALCGAGRHAEAVARLTRAVDYEETVRDLESVARRLVAACGLEWEPACLDFYRNERPVRTASLTQVRQPIYQGSVARWRNTA